MSETQVKSEFQPGTLSVCCLSGGRPERLVAILELLRPVADEIVVGVDDRVDRRQLGRVRALADRLEAFPFVEPFERSLAWLHSLCHGDWVFRIDDDETPSPALLAALAGRDDALTHAWVPRRWLWADGWLDGDPWAPDWQLRLVRAGAARFPGRLHIPVQADGPHAYLEAPLYHLDLVVNSRARREAKARRYEELRPGLRLGGLPLNAAYYVPELRDDLPVRPLPAEDAALVAHVTGAAPSSSAIAVPLSVATREEVDAHWLEGGFAEEDYRARIELGRPPAPIAGEVRELDVRVTNRGTRVWPGGAQALPEIRLSYRWEGVEHLDEQLRTALPRDVGPGESVLVPLAFRAPSRPGRHVLVVDLVHERHRWFGAETTIDVEVRPRRSGVVLVGQPPGERAFDLGVEELLAHMDPSLEPVLVGPKEDWLRDRFGTEARAEPPADAARVFVVPAGPRRQRLRLWRAAHRLEVDARRRRAADGGPARGRRAFALAVAAKHYAVSVAAVLLGSSLGDRLG
jgi:hypothetical protein